MIARVWSRDTSLFTPPAAGAAPSDAAPPAVPAAIANRLGWLDTPVTMPPKVAEIREVMAGARADGLTHMVLVGMGGSSLCADVLRQSVPHAREAAGPRHLHSTGQYHKGGPNSGHFILMSSVDETSTEIPGAGYTFSTLKRAQALGDVDALAAAGREVLHIHLTEPSDEPSMMMERVLSE